MKYLLSFFALVILVGCQKFFFLDVAQKNSDLIFSNDEAMSKCTNGIAIYDFEVIYKNNKGSNTAWNLVRESRLSQEKGVYQLPIIYGKAYKGVRESKKAMELISGVYKLGATLSCLTSSDTLSLSMLGAFAIDSEGKIITDKEEVESFEKNITRQIQPTAKSGG